MNFIIPVSKIEEALQKELYGVIKEAFLMAENILEKRGKVVIQEDKLPGVPETIAVFETKEELFKWFEKIIGYKPDYAPSSPASLPQGEEERQG